MVGGLSRQKSGILYLHVVDCSPCKFFFFFFKKKPSDMCEFIIFSEIYKFLKDKIYNNLLVKIYNNNNSIY